MKVLIIEDNVELSLLLNKFLLKNGFVVDVANTGDDGEYFVSINRYDVILLDLNLPDMNGLDILKSIRKTSVDTAILIITANNDLDNRIKGLDIGADDYIAKPFDFNELLARIRANIRRVNGRVDNEIRLGNLIINQGLRKAFYCNNEIVLSQKEFDILEYIALKSPNVVYTSDLIEHVYSDSIDPFSSVVRVHITNLRKKLAISSDEVELKTVKGIGYVLCEREN